MRSVGLALFRMNLSCLGRTITPLPKAISLIGSASFAFLSGHTALPGWTGWGRLWEATWAGPRCRMVAQGNVEGNAHAAGSNRQPADPSPRRQVRPHPRALPPPRPQNPEYPTHFRTFRNEKDWRLIKATCSMLETSGFYWGPMAVEEAHARLREEPLGTFLVRDSRQKDVFFTLSYRSPSGPVSIRINFQGSRFSLTGSKESFDSLFKLLEHYTSSPRESLTRPYRKVRLRSLQELCRQRIVGTCGGERIHSIPVNPIVKDFLLSFPFRLWTVPPRLHRY